MARCKNALKAFEAANAEGIAAVKADFVKFLREGELPGDSLDLVALNIFITIRSILKDKPGSEPIPAGKFFPTIVEDGAYHDIDYWDNPVPRDVCPKCGGDGYVPKAAPKPRPKPKARRGVRGV